jgi:hypothetical protein
LQDRDCHNELQNKGGDWTEELEDTLGKIKQGLKFKRHRGECKAHLQVHCHDIIAPFCMALRLVSRLAHMAVEHSALASKFDREESDRICVERQVTYQPIGKEEVERIREGEDPEDAEDDQVHGRCLQGFSCR